MFQHFAACPEDLNDPKKSLFVRYTDFVSMLGRCLPAGCVWFERMSLISRIGDIY